MQLMDEDTLLIRYEIPKRSTSYEAANENYTSHKPNFKLFVFYSISEDSVFRIYRDNSTELIYLQRHYYDDFRNVRSAQTGRPASSCGNNPYFRNAFNWCVFTHVKIISFNIIVAVNSIKFKIYFCTEGYINICAIKLRLILFKQ